MKSISTPSITSKSVFVFIMLFMSLSVSASTTDTTVNNGNGIIYKSISARTTEKSVLINWNTLSEFNNNHFEVERSTDMATFKTVAIVLDGFSEEGTGKSYSFKESINELNKSGSAYYRLKQVDVAGSNTYSDIIKVSK